MDFEFSNEEKKVLKDVKAFIKSESTPELLAESHQLGHIYGGQEGRKFIRKFAVNGWLTPNWPEEYGGIGSSAVLNFGIREEMAWAGVPIIFVAAHMAGPTIMHFASEEMKNEWLLPIARGDVEFALGYTEPQAGSDLSSIDIQAVDNGDNFIINGQKSFNTHSHVADYHWLAAITDPDAKRYHGMSMMIVDLKSPGIDIRPMITMAGWQTNEVFYNDVTVPKKNLVGEVNQGFYYLMSALDFERMYPLAAYQRFLSMAVDFSKETNVGGQPLSKNPLVRQKLAQLRIEIEANKLLYYRLAYMIDKGEIPNYESSMQKLYATETAQHITNTVMDVLGMFGGLKEGSKRAVLSGIMEQAYRSSVVETIYAGTSEVQRNIIALRGLKLPTK
ncbi:MAG: acyl-CoA dehydrogenase [Deltaproteobacteria bacterium]|jgi:3-oxocholest-4-en-26-oyl-CoA dehydrogenase alpha subunit|nr:acyl-CoA dehydrogenase [Deltaproteobacteria bacterium]MBT4089630.1 acyl-CoA dehydrogenase [Deltaproteobacteria bacterium]MBT4263093.1 acyl-CoA dehydrogenase [Deltaproteobacteria bacterium]MBT4643444.1 acyl-CoA dehydrogenase [Deltaproteobacteria bacterium]MBT6502493.1 acyl-CoA dehydrogenase [Deltaproteobacteria bacterium]